MNSIWTKWVLAFSLIVMIGGICFAFVFPYMLPHLLKSFFTEITNMWLTDLTSAEIRFHNLLYGVIGGVMFSGGLMRAFLWYRPVKQPETWIWTVIAVSLVVWYVSDTLASIMAWSSLYVMLNTSILLLAAPPMLVNRRSITEGLNNLRVK